MGDWVTATMAHGNTSDLVFLALLVGAIQSWAAPGLLFSSALDSSASTLVKFSGGLVFALGMAFSGIKWNPINGKLAALGGFCAVANSVILGASTGHLFFYAFAAVIIVGVVHIGVFPSNPPVPKGPENKNNHGNI